LEHIAYQFVVFFRRFPKEVISMILLIVSRIWRTNRRFAVGILAICCALALAPAMYGQTNQTDVNKNDDNKQLATDSNAAEPALPSAPTGEAKVYVYRIGSMVGALNFPMVFINGHLTGVLQNSHYVQAKVPQGMTVITAAQGEIRAGGVWLADSRGLGNGVFIPGPNRNLPTLPGCEGVDFISLRADLIRLWTLGEQVPMQRGDTTRCQETLRYDAARILEDLGKEGPTTEVIDLCKLQKVVVVAAKGLSWTGYSREETASCADELSGALTLLRTTSVPAGPGPTHIAIPVEAGKAYYARWSVTFHGGKLDLVDEETGAKHIRKLHPEKSQ
jgi:hypothetical protein